MEHVRQRGALGRLRSFLRAAGSGTRGSFLKIVGGSAGGQLILAASALLLARLYSPVEFGAFAVALAVVVTLGTVSPLRFDAAISIPKRQNETSALVVLGLLSISVFTTAGLALAIAHGQWLANAVNVPSLADWAWTIPLLASLVGAHQVFNPLAIRARRYNAIAQRSLLTAGGAATAQVGAGLAGAGFGGLVVGYGLGQALGLTSLLRGSGIGRNVWSDALEAGVRRVAREYRRFPMFLGPAALLNVLSLQLPVVLISGLYGPDESGWFGMTQRVVGVPVALVVLAMGQVYLGEMAQALIHRPAAALRFFDRASKALSVGGLAIAIGLATLGPWAFQWLLGATWQVSGDYARALAISLAAQVVASPLASTLAVLGRQPLVLFLDFTRLSVMTLAIVWVAEVGGSSLEAVWALGVSGFATYAAYWLCSRHAIATAVRRHDE